MLNDPIQDGMIYSGSEQQRIAAGQDRITRQSAPGGDQPVQHTAMAYAVRVRRGSVYALKPTPRDLGLLANRSDGQVIPTLN